MGAHSLRQDPDPPVPTAKNRPAAPRVDPAGGESARGARHARSPAKTAKKPTAVKRPPTATKAGRFYERKRVLIGAAVAGAIVAVGISFAVTRSSVPARPCEPDYIGKQSSDVCADSRGSVTMDDFTISATPLAAADDENGGLSLCSSVTLTNNSGDKQDYNAADFKIQNPNGEASSPDSSDVSGTLRSGALGPGGTKTGTICDDRPSQKGLYAFVYEPSLFGEQRGVWLSQH